MKMSLNKIELAQYISKQLESFFPDKYRFEGKDINRAIDDALMRAEFCFEKINFRHFSENGEANFKHLYSDQYSQVLYLISNSLWKQAENKPICDKLVLLNRALHGILCPYTVQLPKIFFFVHPIGTVIGDALFSDYLAIAQNVTINKANGDDGKEALRIGRGVFLSAGCKIIGNGRIGDRVSIGVNTVIHNRDIPDDKVAFQNDCGKLVIKDRGDSFKAQEFFHTIY